MEDLFYLLLGVAVIVLPIYLIVKAFKNKGKKEKVIKEKSIVNEKKIKNEKEKSFGKMFAIIFGSVIGFIFLIVAIAMIATGGKVEPVDNSSKAIKEIKSSLNVNNEEAQAIEDVLKSVGIDEVEDIEYDESLNEIEGIGSKGYRIKASFSQNNSIILYVGSDNKVISIRWADKDFYRNGQVLLNFKDYVITWDEKNEYNIDAQKRIKALLKAPSTAKFPSISNWKFGKDNGIIIVQAYVDSENSYGAKIRSEFQIKYDNNKNVISLIIDGVEYIK
ncbi:MAG: hypothetical protein ACI4XR_01425 [Bacilli bacterium]